MTETMMLWQFSPLSGSVSQGSGSGRGRQIPGGAPDGAKPMKLPGMPSGDHPCSKRLMRLLKILAAHRRRLNRRGGER